jgi:hypothetical protein
MTMQKSLWFLKTDDAILFIILPRPIEWCTLLLTITIKAWLGHIKKFWFISAFQNIQWGGTGRFLFYYCFLAGQDNTLLKWMVKRWPVNWPPGQFAPGLLSRGPIALEPLKQLVQNHKLDHNLNNCMTEGQEMRIVLGLLYYSLLYFF